LIWIALAAAVTGNNFLYIIFGMIAGLGIASHLAAKANIKSVQAARVFPSEIFAGSSFPVRYVMTSANKPWGSVTISFSEGGPLQSNDGGVNFVWLKPGESAQQVGFHSIASRGDHKIAPGWLSSSFPFGLATYSLPCGPEDSILVFPRIEAIPSDIAFSLAAFGGGWEQPDHFGTVPHHFRDYVTGDPRKLIDWKKTARSGQLTTRILGDEGGRQATIRLPARASEEAISMAASLVVHFRNTGAPTALEGPGVMIEAGVGREFSAGLLAILARWETHESGSPTTGRTAGTVIIIGQDGAVTVRRPEQRQEES
jgi:uncharacterized protein (DUF58 family)